MRTILIADHDLGFTFWLGGALGEAGFSVLPARSVIHATRMVHQFKVDLVIANPSLAGIADFIESLRQQQPQLKVIAATSRAESGTGNLTSVDGSLSKPVVATEAWKRRWVDQVAAATSGAVLPTLAETSRPPASASSRLSA